MLLINEDKIAAIKSIDNKKLVSENSLLPIILATNPDNPEFFNPLLIIKTSATVNTAGCANP